MIAAGKLETSAVSPSARSVAELRLELVRRFPGAVIPSESASREPHVRSHLHEAPFAWVEVALGEGGLAWLAAWTLLSIARDPLSRPALWVDTHGTLTPGDLIDLEGKLVVVRPADPNEAHVATDVALRAGSFSFVALEMHRALHPAPLSRLARLANGRKGRERVVVWGEPPSFVAPPSGVPRTSFGEAIAALFESEREIRPAPMDLVVPPHALSEPADERSRALHSTDRLRPLDRAADRRAPPKGGGPADHVDVVLVHDDGRQHSSARPR